MYVHVYICVDLISSMQFYTYVDWQYDIQVFYFSKSVCVLHIIQAKFVNLELNNHDFVYCTSYKLNLSRIEYLGQYL